MDYGYGYRYIIYRDIDIDGIDFIDTGMDASMYSWHISHINTSCPRSNIRNTYRIQQSGEVLCYVNPFF